MVLGFGVMPLVWSAWPVLQDRLRRRLAATLFLAVLHWSETMMKSGGAVGISVNNKV
jgi:hypothetical protein